MKKLFFAALLTVTLATSASAKDVNKISFRTLKNFNVEFTEAENVSWKTTNDYAKATFELKGEKREAFFDLHGDMIGISKNITLDQLPVFAKRTFAKRYNGYTVKEAIHFIGVDSSDYYISAENEKESVILKVTEDNSLSVFKKDRKN